MKTGPVTKVVRETRDLRPVRFLARAGFAVNGLVHTIIGLIAVGVAFRGGGGGGDADQSGALAHIAASPGGIVTLWVVTVALAALGLWLILGVGLIRSGDSKRRIGRVLVEVGKGIAYLLLAGTAFTFARGESTDSEAEVESLSARLIAAPGGVFALLLLAVAVLAVGVYFVVKGVRRRFVDDIELPDGKRGTALVALGIFGYVAKGVALATVGVLLAVAAARSEPSQASGLDGSLRALVALPLGQIIIAAIGLGLVSYGVYCFVRARIARL